MTQNSWIENIQAKYSAGIAHAFILSGNVNDYVVPGVGLRRFLAESMKTRVVAFYNRSAGFSFPLPSMQAEFAKLAGLEAQPAQVDNPALAALRAAGLGPQAPAQAGEVVLPSSPEAALPLIEKALRAAARGRLAVVIEFAETIAPNADISTMAPNDRTNLVTLARLGRDAEIAAAGQMIYLVTDSLGALSDTLKSASNKWDIVEVPYPDFSARLSFISWYLEAQPVDSDITPRALAAMTAGLNLLGIEDIFLRASLEGALTAAMVKDRKAQIISAEYGDVLEVMDPAGGFELVGGLDYIKAYFSQSVIGPMRAGNYKRVPMGVLMLGPAGTGKTIMAAAVAKEAGLNAVKLNIGGQIASKWQGEGERLLSKALAGVLNFAPTIVFMDEIDQSVSRGSGDNQQDSRIFQMLLEFMSDTSHRGQVVFLAATNRPDLMDSALRRPGRFDDKIAFLVPGDDERESIFQVFARKFSLDLSSVPAQAVSMTQGYTGAELEAITRKAAILAEDFGLDGQSALVQACGKIKPTTRDIQYMTNLALAEINDLDLLPPAYQAKAADKVALEDELRAQAPETRKARQF